MKKRHLKTIRMKLIIPILCAVILSSAVMGYISNRITSDIIINAAIDDGLNAAKSLREYIDLVISTAELDLSAIVLQSYVKPIIRGGSSPDELEKYMHSLIERHPIYNSMIVLNGDGIIVASTSGSTGGERADREYFQVSMTGKNFISEVEVSRQTGHLASFISMPVSDGDKVIGVAMAAVRINEINTRYVAPVSLLGAYGYAMIVNSAGTIIGHRNEEMLGEAIPGDLRERINAIGTERVAFEHIIDGVPSMLFIERSNSTDWFPIVTASISDFYISSDFAARANIILAVCVILLLTIIVIFAVHNVTRVLSTTIKYADAVSRGDLEATLSVRSEDEVGVLAESLRGMVASLKHMITVAEEKTREAEKATGIIIESINYARKIQRDVLPRESLFYAAFSGYSIIWDPRDIVGGDIYWLKTLEKGSVLCVCDCTGHGTSGALLSMLVVSALESVVRQSNCHDTAEILWQLEQKLVRDFGIDKNKTGEIQDGCDIAALFIANDGSVSISSGNTHVFICDGKEVRQIKGQKIYIGEGNLKSKEDIDVINIPANPENKFYIASDGLYDQIGSEARRPYGYKEFKKIILENHGEPQSAISEKIWQAFENHRGGEARRDDVELITFKPR